MFGEIDEDVFHQSVVLYVPVKVLLRKVGRPPLDTVRLWPEVDLSVTSTSSDDITSCWESCQGGPDGAAPLRCW